MATTAIKQCPSCGRLCEEPSRFCPACGTNVEQPQPRRPFPAPVWSPPPRPAPDVGLGSGHSFLVGTVVGTLLFLVVLGVGLYLGGVFGSTGSSHVRLASAPNIPKAPGVATPRSPAPSATSAGTETYNGQAFSIQYPAGWSVKSAETQQSWGTDTTIVSPSDPNVLLRVDVSPNTTVTDPLTAAQPVINQLQQEPRYQQLDLTSGTFDGFPAEHWGFRVDESGVLLRKEDEFFIDSGNGDGVAVLTQAPAADYGAYSSQFAALRQSLSMS